MPFLAAAVPAIAGGVASAAAGAGISALTSGAQRGAQAANAPQSINLANPLQTASGTLDQQQQLINALGQTGAESQQASNLQQQQALAGQLGQLAQGNGPNPALAQLAQTTGQNVQQQAALAAGQRGAGANVGLIARNAADVGAQAQQGAAGQAATLRAQQQLAGISALQQQQGLQAQTAQGLIGQRQAGLQGLSGQQLAGQEAFNAQRLAQQQGINQINAGYGQQQAGTQGQLMGQIGGGIASGVGSGLAASLTPSASSAGVPSSSSSASGEGFTPYKPQLLADGGPVYANSSNQVGALKENYKGRSKIGSLLMASGGKVPALVSPGEIYLTPKKAKEVALGKALPSSGERIKGKAKVAGNSYANDTVKKTLQSGGVVIPRSASQDSDKARRFVEAVMHSKARK